MTNPIPMLLGLQRKIQDTMGNSASEGSEKVHKELLLAKVRINDALTVEALLGQGVDPTCCDDSNNTPLHIAASEGHITVLSVLLNHDMDFDARNNDMKTPLMCAASNGHSTVLRMLLDKCDRDKTLVNDQDGHDTTLLIMAATEGHASVVEVLLSCDNIQFDVTDELGMTALHCAVLYERLDVFWMLLQAGADPWIHDHRRTYPLMSASIRGFTEIVRTLLNRPDSIDYVSKVNSENFTALHMAVRMDFVAIATALIEAGADLNACDNMGLTPVMWAAQYGREQLTWALISAGCDPSCTDIRGRNVLHHAAFFGWTHIVSDLLDSGMDSHIQSSSGNTPIILAVRNNHFRIIKLILNHNCDTSIPHSLQKRFSTLLTLALERGREDICELLHKAGCSLNDHDVAQVLKDMHPIHSTGVIAQAWVDKVLKSPRLLQDTCRIVIRNRLSQSVRSKAQNLPIPTALQSVLLLDDIQCQEPFDDTT